MKISQGDLYIIRFTLYINLQGDKKTMSVPASSTEEEDISQLRLEGDESDESSTGEPEEDDDAKDLEETIQV